MSIWTRLYEHTDYRGRSTFASLPATSPVSTYLQISKSWLDAVHLHDRISSFEFGTSAAEQGGRLILFQDSQYRGRYAMWDLGSGATLRRPNLSAQSFNDKTSSALLVRRFSNEMGPLALGDLGTPSLRDQISAAVASTPHLSPRGDAIITWDMWPSFSPSRKYVYVRVPVVVDIPHWFDYDAEIRFWIYFYVDSGHKIRGYMNWYGAWVEGGILTDKVLDRLMDEIPAASGQINAMIAEALEMVNLFNFVGLYYLPGTAAATGRVTDDVSLVLVKAW